MDRPSTSQQSVEKVEMFEVREHVPYQAEITRAPAAYDEESGDVYNSSWDSAWAAICQLFNLLHHMQVAIVVFSLWHFALTSAPNGAISNLQLHIIFAGTGVCITSIWNSFIFLYFVERSIHVVTNTSLWELFTITIVLFQKPTSNFELKTYQWI